MSARSKRYSQRLRHLWSVPSHDLRQQSQRPIEAIFGAEGDAELGFYEHRYVEGAVAKGGQPRGIGGEPSSASDFFLSVGERRAKSGEKTSLNLFRFSSYDFVRGEAERGYSLLDDPTRGGRDDEKARTEGSREGCKSDDVLLRRCLALSRFEDHLAEISDVLETVPCIRPNLEFGSMLLVEATSCVRLGDEAADFVRIRFRIDVEPFGARCASKRLSCFLPQEAVFHCAIEGQATDVVGPQGSIRIEGNEPSRGTPQEIG